MSRLSDTRLYVVTATDTGGERLMRAANKARAVRQAAVARIATAADIERLFEAGVVIETQIPRPSPPPRPKQLRAQRRA